MCGLLHFKSGYCVSIFSGCSNIFFLTAGCSRDDAVYDELQKADGDRKSLPVDEDLPGMGQYYCLHCDRYFANVVVRDEHFKTKRHKKRNLRCCMLIIINSSWKEIWFSLFFLALMLNLLSGWRLKQMMGPAPHTQLDSDLAAGMGMPDNGPKLMST
ncbi:Zinc finger protein [Sesamum angolense]|uniref:Zinc finger protein n=1 Tax=Sesamum angolense TaxID=2727404 RepID=A0AAE2BSX2_9LAMI|nr:Zinc finger protein [Sesamum angolense]